MSRGGKGCGGKTTCYSTADPRAGRVAWPLHVPSTLLHLSCLFDLYTATRGGGSSSGETPVERGHPAQRSAPILGAPAVSTHSLTATQKGGRGNMETARERERKRERVERARKKRIGLVVATEWES